MLIEFMAHEPLSVEEKTRLTYTQQLAFQQVCREIGIKRADVLRAMILKLIRDHHQQKALQAVGLESTAGGATE